MDYGTLRVTSPDGQVREYPLDAREITVGRSLGNRVRIEHVSLSLYHARLLFADAGPQVEDVGSASGTYVGAVRVLPNSPRPFAFGQALSFGDCDAVLLQPAAAPTPAAESQPVAPTAPPISEPAPVATPVEAPPPPEPAVPVATPAPVSPPPPPEPPPPPAQEVGLRLALPATPVAPGTATSATLTLRNASAAEDAYAIRVDGIPAEWVQVSRPGVTLAPGASDDVTIRIQPPRGPQALAGDVPFSVAVVSTRTGVEVRALGKVVVLPFEEFALTLQAAGRDFQALVTNQGNAPLHLSLRAEGGTGSGEEPEVRGDGQLTVAPGEQAVARVRVPGSKSGATSFRVIGRSAASGAEVAAAGQARGARPVPWRLIAVGVAAVLVIAGLAWAAMQFTGGGDDDARADGDGGKGPTATRNAASPPAGQTTLAATTAAVGQTSPTPTGPTAILPYRYYEPSRMFSGAQARVTNSGTGASCTLEVRDRPSKSGTTVLTRLCDGQQVTMVSNTPPASAFLIGEGWIWVRAVFDTSGRTGWVTERLAAGSGFGPYLEPVSTFPGQ